MQSSPKETPQPIASFLSLQLNATLNVFWVKKKKNKRKNQYVSICLPFAPASILHSTERHERYARITQNDCSSSDSPSKTRNTVAS